MQATAELHIVTPAALMARFDAARPFGETEGRLRQMRVLGALSVRPMNYREIVDFVYDDDPEGGPENGQNAVAQMIFKLRHKGYDIRRIGGHRYEWVR